MKRILAAILALVSSVGFAAIGPRPDTTEAVDPDPWIDVFLYHDNTKLQANTSSFRVIPYSEEDDVLLTMEFRSYPNDTDYVIVGVIGTKSCVRGSGRLVVYVRGTEEYDQHVWNKDKKASTGMDSVAYTICTALEVKMEIYKKQHGL
jgi:hypothetical protein